MYTIKGIGMLVLLMVTGLWAQDAMVKKNIRVRPGWTESKMLFMENWNNISSTEKTNSVNEFSSRLNALQPYVSDFGSDPDREDGGEAFYPAVSKMIETLKDDKDNARLAARINEMLSDAERLVEYRRTHVFTGKGPQVLSYNVQDNGANYTPLAAGDGWINAWVQDSAGDNAGNPVICQADSFLFAAVVRHLSEDYVTIYRSSDHGANWNYWTGFYTSGYSAFPSSMAYDVQNHALLIAAYSASNNGTVLFVRYNDLNNPADWNYVWGDDSTDMASQPQLSVEYTFSGDRICILYHNATTNNDVVLQSTDHGDTWTSVYVSPWTGGYSGAPKGAQGNNGGQGADRFLFVTSLPDTNKLTVLTSASGISGAWSSTELTDPYQRYVDDADISGSHSTSLPSTMVVYEAHYSSTHTAIRGWYTPSIGDSSFSFFFIWDNTNILLVRSPRVTTDGEWTDEAPSISDNYHIAYFADADNDSNYYNISARRIANNWTLIDSSDYWESTETNEYFMYDSLGAITANYIWDYGTPQSYYQIDNTTFSTGLASDPYVTSIVWCENIAGQGIVASSTPDISSGISEQNFSVKSIGNGFLYSNGMLTFGLSHDGYVDIRIFDVKGSEVKHISSNYKKGENSISLNGMKNGMYFAILATPDVNRTFRFIKVK